MKEKPPNNRIVSSVYSILKDKTRRKILNLLSKRALSANDLTKKLKITRQGVEKHLKKMLRISLIERRAETVPNLHYIYYLPEYTQELMSDLTDCLESFIEGLKEYYETRLEEEEQLFLLGKSTKQKYKVMKRAYDKIMGKIKND